MTFLDSKISIQIIKSSSENESFTVSAETVIDIDVSSQQVDLLSKDIENKLNVEDIALNSDELTEENKKILKEIIESKAISKDTIVSNIDLVINEDIYEKIVKILSYQLTPKDTNKESILTNKEKALSYFYKGILLSGNSGIGKTHLINYIKKKYLIENKIAYFDIDMYSPTMTGLKYLLPLVVKGGVVLFDEYGVLEWSGESRAVEDYFKDNNLDIKIKKFPWNNIPGGYFIK